MIESLSPKIGLVTVLYKSDEVLDGFFKSISIQDYGNYFIYIIDNSANDLTDTLIKHCSQKYSVYHFQHIKSDMNLGVAAGNNIGIVAALKDKCEYVLLLNNDIEFEQPYLLSRMVDEATVNPQLLFIPKILFFDTQKIWMAGGRFDIWKPMTIHIGEGKADNGKYDQPTTFKYAPTCFMLLHRTVFENVGMMDERYFVYYDDTDFIYRCIRLGYKISYLPNLVVLHKISSSTGGKESVFSIYYGNRNRIFFIRKHLKGVLKLIAYTYTFSSRAIKMLSYNKEQNNKLKQGIIDGFKMPV